uniref:(California timema) hypothetical protein n=1 Tax=Timema californicum TaxID=61474 RepID=A0A7R9JGQ7_TIMCA|nr:unnamed protein product [Timema californicum]
MLTVVTSKVCSILLLADHMFFRHVAARNVRTATNLMLDMLHEADAIFRNSDFNGDGLPDNIGFKARYIIILTSSKSSMNHLQGYGLDGGAPVDGKVYLHHLSSYELLHRVCAGVAFTAQPFQSKALGLSFTSVRNSLGRNGDQIGGICDRPRGSGLSFNALTITLMTDTGLQISRATSQLALAHELGHSFGARHDPLEGACQGYLMKPTSLNGSQRTHYSFSPCSLRQIAHTIKLKGYCLDEFEHPYCGNGTYRDILFYSEVPLIYAYQRRLQILNAKNITGPIVHNYLLFIILCCLWPSVLRDI